MTTRESLAQMRINESARLHAASSSLSEPLTQAAGIIINSVRKGGKVLVCGNGGSAADAQHIAGDLVGRFLKERKGIPAIALTTDTSVLTAWSNDYSYNSVFLRQIEALGKRGDVLIAISTSGNSENVLRAAAYAKKIGMRVVSLTGKGGGKLAGMSDVLVAVDSSTTPRVQEMHVLCFHIICEIVEEELSR